MNESALEYILERVVNTVLETASDISEKDDFSLGKRSAYYEVLDTIKSELLAHDVEPGDYKLDFDLESIL